MTAPIALDQSALATDLLETALDMCGGVAAGLTAAAPVGATGERFRHFILGASAAGAQALEKLVTASYAELDAVSDLDAGESARLVAAPVFCARGARLGMLWVVGPNASTPSPARRLERLARISAALFFENSAPMGEAGPARLATLREVDAALDRGEFEAAFQPIVRLKDRSIVSFEALARWRSPERGVLSPAAFQAALEDPFLSSKISCTVLRQGLRAAAAFSEQAGRPIRVAVNLTRMQLLDPAFVARVTEFSASIGVSLSNLTVELTETTVLDDLETIRAQLYELRARGARVAFDDFGTGFASLSHLQLLPLDVIKLDRAFIRELRSSGSASAIVHSVVSLARDLNVHVVAEGVEDAETADRLVQLGCCCAQGYYFSRPVFRPEAEGFAAQGVI